MKKVLLVALALLLSAYSSVWAVDKQITFGWNYDATEYEKVEGWKLYEGTASGATDTLKADVPVADVPPLDPSATTLDMEKSFNFSIPENAVTTLYFTLTAYNANGESAKSGEVSATYDFLDPPAVSDLSATYDEQLQEVVFSWTFPTEWLAKIERWELYESDTSGGPYTKIVDIPYDPNATQPYTTNVQLAVPQGSKVTKYYTLVTYRPAENNSAFSPDSNEVTLTINRMPPTSPFEFKIKVK